MEERKPIKCTLCSNDSDDSDIAVCAGCDRIVCGDCIAWCCNPDDEADGDWFCEHCINAVPEVSK